MLRNDPSFMPTLDGPSDQCYDGALKSTEFRQVMGWRWAMRRWLWTSAVWLFCDGRLSVLVAVCSCVTANDMVVNADVPTIGPEVISRIVRKLAA